MPQLLPTQLPNQDPQLLDASSRIMWHTAKRLGISCTMMPDLQTIAMQYQGLTWYTRGSRTSFQSAVGQTIVANKATAKAFLQAHRLPTAKSLLVETTQDLAALSQLTWPLVMKPVRGAHGQGVVVGLPDLATATTAFTTLNQPVLFEEMLQGTEYRIVCVEYQMVAAAYRRPAQVVGDGHHTITQLVEQTNQNPQRSKGHKGNLTTITIDELVLQNLAQQNLTPESIPALSMIVPLRKTANLSTGGEAFNVTAEVCPENRELFTTIAKVVDLNVVGIDIMCQSLATPITTQADAGVIEINKSPGLRMHHFPSGGEAIDVAAHILTAAIHSAQALQAT